MSENPAMTSRSSRLRVEDLRDVLARTENLQLVDVRQPVETEAGTIEGAMLVPLTKLAAEISSLDPTKATVVYCAGGFRSSIATSWLIASGFDDVSDLLGGYGAWANAQQRPTNAQR